MGFIFDEIDLCLTDDWYENINDVLETISDDNSIMQSDMQVDTRLEKDGL